MLKIAASLPIMARWYLSINKKYVNQVLFIQSVNEATKVKNQGSKGIIKTSCDLQNIMKKEINLFVDKEIENEYKIE
jgi:hypothetical protein